MRELQVDDVIDLATPQRMEYHDVVDAIQKLRLEHPAERHQHILLHRAPCRISGLPAFEDHLTTHVRRHDDDRVAEVDGASLRIGEASVVEQLQQNIEHIGMRLLDFVEQDHGVRTATHGLGELATFFVAHVTRRRADEPRHGMLLHVLRHVDAYHGVFVVEQKFGERLGGLRLAHTGRPEEDEGADRTIGVLQPGA